MSSSSQTGTTDRQQVAAGRFYSANSETLAGDLKILFNECTKTAGNNKVRAIITPHAGYVFSGKTAAAGFSTIPRDAVFENIFIIGSSHVMSFDGASVYDKGDYITPLGKIKVNREIAEKLKSDNIVFRHPATPHIQEHSIEVQLPFIQFYFSRIPSIVPVIIGTNDIKTVRKIADALMPWFTPGNLFIISSDFSHYPSYQEAIMTDRETANAIATGKPEAFLSVLKENSRKKIKGLATSMCGWTSCLTLLYLAGNQENLEFNLVDYSNSGDSSYGGKDEVVGYHAISLIEKNGKDDPFSFTEDEKNQLFDLARRSIETQLGLRDKASMDYDMSPRLSEHMGAFVTLKINGSLRGCIGRFFSEDPLCEVVKASALSSAFGDPRFSPLTPDEYGKTEIEITVLGPLKRIHDMNEIKLGRHGIYIRKDLRSGTMLPQVAVENKWTIEQFLGYTSRDKAGLGWDGWRDAELYIYEGVVLEERDK